MWGQTSLHSGWGYGAGKPGSGASGTIRGPPSGSSAPPDGFSRPGSLCCLIHAAAPVRTTVRFPQLSPDRPAATLSKTRPGLACWGACVSSGLRFPTGEVRASRGESQGGGASRGPAVLSGALASLPRKAVRSVSGVRGAGAGLPLHCVPESLGDSGRL
ncbi:unnamed protein product [Rangifer tarandus platyrhynchus]|uniref:Uncharacterized protein n=1 Tax=Rangifer tarandus platyrhynchus TaxID=3082113 RepID=A0ABN8ZDR7_RANTA|nr:unnamed protein product [Rangifer tarandus platyrhynchus]